MRPFYLHLQQTVDDYRRSFRWNDYNIDRYEIDDAFVAHYLLNTVVMTGGREYIDYVRTRPGMVGATLTDSTPQSDIFSEMESRLEKLDEYYRTPEFWEEFTDPYYPGNVDGSYLAFDYELFRRSISNLHKINPNICFTNLYQFQEAILEEYERLYQEGGLHP